MWLFKKKLIAPPICNHKYKDFPWYMNNTYYINTNKLDLCIKEPYVCIKCKDRKDITLYKTTYCQVTKSEANAIIKNLQEEYKDKLKPLPIINDMIADMQLVDREYLDALDSILNPKNPFEKS